MKMTTTWMILRTLKRSIDSGQLVFGRIAGCSSPAVYCLPYGLVRGSLGFFLESQGVHSDERFGDAGASYLVELPCR